MKKLRLHGSVTCPGQTSQLTGGRARIQAQVCMSDPEEAHTPSVRPDTQTAAGRCRNLAPQRPRVLPSPRGDLPHCPLSFLSWYVCSEHPEALLSAATCISPGPCPDSVRVCSVQLRARASSAKPRLIYHLQDDVHPERYATSKFK